MTDLEQVLHRDSGTLIRELTAETGMSIPQAEEFFRVAGSALLASYLWQIDDLPEQAITSPAVRRELLAGISGRTVSARVGLPAEQTWNGLRYLVSAALSRIEA